MCWTREKPGPKNRIARDAVSFAGGTLSVRDLDSSLQVMDVQDTNSMDPTLDAGNKILVMKARPDDIQAGDIVVFANPYILHRITKVGSDGQGRYFQSKGDNNLFGDSYRWRDHDLMFVVLGVLY